MTTTRRSEPRADCAHCKGSGIIRVSKDPDEVADCVCTDAPRRVQLSRRKGYRKPENTVVVARPTCWGNPYRIVPSGKTTWQVMHSSVLLAEFISRTGSEARADAVERLHRLIEHDRAPWSTDMIRRELAGKNLACWCPLDEPCHADVLLKIANGGADV